MKKKVLSRKEQRKQNRLSKKAKKHEYFSKKNRLKLGKTNDAEHAVKKAAKQPHKNFVEKNKSFDEPGCLKDVNKKKVKQHPSIFDEAKDRLQEEQKQLKNLEKEIRKKKTKQLQLDAAADDLEIKRMEKKLGLQKKTEKAKSKFFMSDGLDYLLDACNKKNLGDPEKGINESDDDFNEDLELVTGKRLKTTKESSCAKRKKNDSDSEPEEFPSKSNSKTTEDSPEESDSDEGEEMDWDDLDEEVAAGASDVEKEGSKLKTNLSSKPSNQRQSKDDESDLNESEEDSEEKEEGDGTWEDIYGRTRDKEGNVITKYQPPQLRKAVETTGASNERLRKQMKGLLNRLAENNMISISSQLEALYGQHSRNEMNEAMWSLYRDSLIAETATPERLIAEHALLLAVLSANIGAEVAAHALQRAVQHYHTLWSEKPDVGDKRTNNLLTLLSFMCLLKLFHCKLLYDILDQLVVEVHEKEVELVLLVLKTVGFTLRKDDPARLKDFVLKIQTLVNDTSVLDGTRAKFLLETVMAIKNNNMSKIPNYNPEYGEHLKKIMRACIRKGNYHAELKISLEDLLKADEKGRWWIVGSAWTGVLPGEREPEERISEKKEQFSNKLLKLAKKQRMNTDARRAVFCVLMSAEDYLDAFEKLLKLRLQGPSEREIMNVLIHCLLQENKYNPYYEHVARRFCNADRRYQIMLQFAAWDRIKEISSLSTSQLKNLSKFLGQLILQKDLALSVLKVVELGGLDKSSMRFMRQVLLTILLSDNEENVLAVFARVSTAKQLRMFRESLRLFLHHFVLRSSKEAEEADREFLSARVKLADMALSSADRGPAF